LEARIGGTLMGCYFTDVPVNDICDGSYSSDRLFDRLTRMRSPSRRRIRFGPMGDGAL